MVCIPKLDLKLDLKLHLKLYVSVIYLIYHVYIKDDIL